MAASDAWSLSGMNGVALVGVGQEFSGLSRGYQVVDAAIVEYEVVRVDGATESVLVAGVQPVGTRIYAPVAALVVNSGQVLVYPESADYTVV